ncbi:MAG: hypothetical protein EBY22_11605 [Gammaproteobacteria bacterium]|nr:hypothetical protein [Gammaproteobacteria bacterium]
MKVTYHSEFVFSYGENAMYKWNVKLIKTLPLKIHVYEVHKPTGEFIGSIVCKRLTEKMMFDLIRENNRTGKFATITDVWEG